MTQYTTYITAPIGVFSTVETAKRTAETLADVPLAWVLGSNGTTLYGETDTETYEFKITTWDVQ